MLAFAVAVVMVMAVGFNSEAESGGFGGPEQIQMNVDAMAMAVARFVMYVVPGALVALYAILAYDGASQAGLQRRGQSPQ